MARTRSKINRRGRPPSLKVAARKTLRLQDSVRGLLSDLEDLEKRLLRLEALLEAGRKAARERARVRRAQSKGIRGKGPNIRDIAYQVMARRKKPMGIQEISDLVLRAKKGEAGGHFTQNLGAALARDKRFTRVSRGVYSVKR
jgi:hypothetical protein